MHVDINESSGISNATHTPWVQGADSQNAESGGLSPVEIVYIFIGCLAFVALALAAATYWMERKRRKSRMDSKFDTIDDYPPSAAHLNLNRKSSGAEALPEITSTHVLFNLQKRQEKIRHETIRTSSGEDIKLNTIKEHE